MNRQEPVIDSRFLKCRTLKDRVDLPWETVENLTKQTQTPIPTQVHVQSQPVAEIEPQPFEPQPLILTEAEKKALIARLAPAVEAALRENLKNTVEMAAENAVTQISNVPLHQPFSRPSPQKSKNSTSLTSSSAESFSNAEAR